MDVVLNSLSGEAISKGLGVLADYGRFLEIGKRDIYMNSRLGMRPFKKNLSFIAIDLDRAMRQKPALISSLFQEMARDIGAGSLATLPHRVFSDRQDRLGLPLHGSGQAHRQDRGLDARAALGHQPEGRLRRSRFAPTHRT